MTANSPINAAKEARYHLEVDWITSLEESTLLSAKADKLQVCPVSVISWVQSVVPMVTPMATATKNRNIV